MIKEVPGRPRADLVDSLGFHRSFAHSPKNDRSSSSILARSAWSSSPIRRSIRRWSTDVIWCTKPT